MYHSVTEAELGGPLGTSDLAGSMVGALVSTALVFRQYGNDPAYSARLMEAANQLYLQATRHPGLYASKFPYSCVSKWAKVRIGASGKPKKPLCVPPTAFAEGSALVFYNSTTFYDDLLWAAAWMYRATGNTSYLEVCLPAPLPASLPPFRCTSPR